MTTPQPKMDSEAYDTKLPWYHRSFNGRLNPEGRQLLESCGIAAEDVDEHIYRVRDEAWKVFPFPCIGGFFFLEFAISQHPRFQNAVEILKKGTSDESADQHTLNLGLSKTEAKDDPVAVILRQPAATRLIDVGTCIGQDLRMFRYKGVPTTALYGSDIFPGFEAIGHDLFRDQDSFVNRFIIANMFDDTPDNAFNCTAGLWDIVTVTMFLHQFDLEPQQQIAKRLLRLLRPVKGSMILGNNAGQLEAMRIPIRAPFHRKGHEFLYRHSRETMQTMWENAINECGEQDLWRISCEYDENRVKKRQATKLGPGEGRFFQGDDQRRIVFSIERL